MATRDRSPKISTTRQANTPPAPQAASARRAEPAPSSRTAFDFSEIRIFADSPPPRPPAQPEADGVHMTAARGIAGAGTPLPFLDRIQTSFGRHAVSHVEAHVDGAASEAARAL